MTSYFWYFSFSNCSFCGCVSVSHIIISALQCVVQGCISCGTCSYLELTEDHVLTSAYVKIFRIVTRNAVNKSFWRKKDCSWPPLNKYAMNIWLSSLKIRAHLSWRTGKHLHVLHVLRTCSTCSCPGQQDTTTYAALLMTDWWTELQTLLGVSPEEIVISISAQLLFILLTPIFLLLVSTLIALIMLLYRATS